jgi:hypothetical protein
MASGSAVSLVVRELAFGVRPVRLRLPFRFGAVTLQACPQLFVRADVEVKEHRSAQGFAAEMMVPKWFDKRAGFAQADNVAHLQRSCERAAQAYLDDAPASPFDLFARHYGALMAAGAADGATALSSAYGQAVIDRAVLDAACRALNVSFFDAARSNLLGIRDDPLVDDMNGFDWNTWLAGLQPLRRIEARHTIGMLDELSAARDGDDGLPITLPAVIERYGVRVFKIKLGGDPGADAARLGAVLDVLDARAPGHRYTLDGNEQYRDVASLADFLARLRMLPAYAARPDALLYLEQPLAREASLDPALRSLNSPVPLLLDEADGSLDAFPNAAEFGWRCVSSKSCKGLYKAIVNRARCERWNAPARRDGSTARYFMSAEDLTCQAGLSVQQDLALLALLGLSHSERNGHHYADGFGEAPAHEATTFAAAHPDLYDTRSGRARLRIDGGQIAIDSLFGPGFAHAADPDWPTLRPLADAPALV